MAWTVDTVGDKGKFVYRLTSIVNEVNDVAQELEARTGRDDYVQDQLDDAWSHLMLAVRELARREGG